MIRYRTSVSQGSRTRKDPSECVHKHVDSVPCRWIPVAGEDRRKERREHTNSLPGSIIMLYSILIATNLAWVDPPRFFDRPHHVTNCLSRLLTTSSGHKILEWGTKLFTSIRSTLRGLGLNHCAIGVQMKAQPFSIERIVTTRQADTNAYWGR